MKAREAAEKCHVRGYIARESDPEVKMLKNSFGFYQGIDWLPGDDWKTYDPEGEEASTAERIRDRLCRRHPPHAVSREDRYSGRHQTRNRLNGRPVADTG